MEVDGVKQAYDHKKAFALREISRRGLNGKD